MKTIAYSSPFVPAEWIAAHGLRPHWLRLRAAEGLTRGVCPYAGALIAAALAAKEGTGPICRNGPGGASHKLGLFPFSQPAGLDASALVLTTTCDQMRYAAALLGIRGSCPVFLLNVPSTWQTPAAAGLYLDELRRLGRFLVGLGGKSPSREELSQAMLARDRERHQENKNNSREPTAPITVGRAFANVVGTLRVPTGRTVDPHAEQSCRHTKCADYIAPPGATTPDSPAIPLAILGGPLLDSDTAMFNLLHQIGACVVLDATEGADRTLPRPFDAARVAVDPLQELAAAYFDAIADPFRRPNSRLYEWLGRELAARQVRGIIFRRYVWCDLWHAELQRLKQWSPVPVLEIDVGPDDTSAPNRVQGRIEAFLETLK
jgi:hypothetical protein